MSSGLEQAIAAIKTGDREKGRRLLSAFIKDEPDNELAWLWLTKVVESRGQQETCLKNALIINPNNYYARRQLAALRLTKASKQDRPGKLEKKDTTVAHLCGKCNTLNSADSKYCRECGSSLIESSQLKKCTTCEREINADSRFCQYCGMQFTVTDSKTPRTTKDCREQTDITENKQLGQDLSSESRIELLRKLDNLENLVAKQTTELKKLERKKEENKPENVGLAMLVTGSVLLYGLFAGSGLALLIGLGMAGLMIVSGIVWSIIMNSNAEKVKKAEAELIQNQAEVKKLQSRLFSRTQ